MALILIVIIMVLGVGLVGSLYTSIIPFVYRLGNVSNYNIAYYGAIMSVERGMSALRYHDAGFEGKSGIRGGNPTDRLSVQDTFGRRTNDTTADSVRKINSRVKSIPAVGKGNVEGLFASIDSKNYNTLTYSEGLELPLYLDTTHDDNRFYQPVDDSDISPLDGGASTITLSGTLRLPPKIQESFEGQALDTDGDVDDDTINDDIIVNWGLKGLDGDISFSIFPTVRNDFSSREPLYNNDNSFRETIINGGSHNINTDAHNGFSIPTAHTNTIVSNITSNNILPLGSTYENEYIRDVITNSFKPYLTFAITNRMQTANSNIYPFLEYQLTACGTATCDIELPDRFFSLQGVGIVRDYTVRINIQKPVRKASNTANFTIIF